MAAFFHVEHVFAKELIVHTVVSLEDFLAEVDGKERLDFSPEVTDFVLEGSFMQFPFFGVFLNI
jgi:hypothetical protein